MQAKQGFRWRWAFPSPEDDGKRPDRSGPPLAPLPIPVTRAFILTR